MDNVVITHPERKIILDRLLTMRCQNPRELGLSNIAEYQVEDHIMPRRSGKTRTLHWLYNELLARDFSCCIVYLHRRMQMASDMGVKTPRKLYVDGLKGVRSPKYSGSIIEAEIDDLISMLAPFLYKFDFVLFDEAPLRIDIPGHVYFGLRT